MADALAGKLLVDVANATGRDAAGRPSGLLYLGDSLAERLQAALPDTRVVKTIDRIADKWAVMVVGHLSQEGTLRFNALMRAIPGVSHRMLTLTLRGLQRDGIVSRTAYPTIPPRVDYALTPLGRSLTDPLSRLAGWAGEHRDQIEAARTAYDAEAGGA